MPRRLLSPSAFAEAAFARLQARENTLCLRHPVEILPQGQGTPERLPSLGLLSHLRERESQVIVIERITWILAGTQLERTDCQRRQILLEVDPSQACR